MYCKECGLQIADGSKFCKGCGKQQSIVENIFAVGGQSINQTCESPEELSLWGYYVKCFKNYANFEGRARRSEYWGFFLFNIIISSGLEVFDAILFGWDSKLVGLYFLIALLPHLGVSVRRLHDIGKSGWWVLIGFIISVVGAICAISSIYWPLIFVFIFCIVFFIWFVTDSEYGENIYGQNPKGIK